jgi:hypothetical protein
VLLVAAELRELLGDFRTNRALNGRFDLRRAVEVIQRELFEHGAAGLVFCGASVKEEKRRRRRARSRAEPQSEVWRRKKRDESSINNAHTRCM